MTQRAHYIYTAIIVVFAFSTVWWVQHSYEHDDAAEHYVEHIKDYPLLDPALPFYDNKNLIVNIQELRSYLRTLPEQNEEWADMSIYFEVLNTGANISVNSDVKVLPASLTKLPVAMIAMKKVEDGIWNMNTEFTLTKEVAIASGQSVNPADVGSKYKFSELLDRMLIESDNSAYFMVLSRLSQSDLLSVPEAVGLDEEFSREEKISAKEYTRFFRALYQAVYLNQENSQKILELLSKSTQNNLLRGGIPSDTKFSHKWGINDLQNVYSDSGIVYLPNERPYLISVMIQGKSTDKSSDRMKADKLIQEIGKRSYDFMVHAK